MGRKKESRGKNLGYDTSVDVMWIVGGEIGLSCAGEASYSRWGRGA